MTDADGEVLTRRHGSVFEIVVARPKKLNSYTPKMLNELALAYTAFENDEAARCALLTVTRCTCRPATLYSKRVWGVHGPCNVWTTGGRPWSIAPQIGPTIPAWSCTTSNPSTCE